MTSQSYGDSTNLGGQNPKTPKLIDKKFGVGDYADDDSLYAKIHNDRPIAGVQACA